MKIHVDEGPLSPTMGDKCVAVIQKPTPLHCSYTHTRRESKPLGGSRTNPHRGSDIKARVERKKEVLRLSSWSDPTRDGKRAVYDQDEQGGAGEEAHRLRYFTEADYSTKPWDAKGDHVTVCALKE